MTLEKPKSITIEVSDRKAKRFSSFVVYGMTVEEVIKKIKKILSN